MAASLLFAILLISFVNNSCAEGLYDGSYRELGEFPQDIPVGTTRIMLDGNELTSIEDYTFASFANLTSLHLERNRIENIGPYAFCNTSISHLFLDDNLLKELPQLECIAGTLVVFTARNNLIEQLDASTFLSGDQQLTLQNLDLSHNRIHEVPANIFARLNSLTSLDLSHNQLSRFPDFHLLSANNSLKELHVAANNLSSLGNTSLDNFPKLRILDLAYNSLTAIPDLRHIHKNLRSLLINNNNLSTIEGTAFIGSNLEVLNLGGTNLHGLAPLLPLNRTLRQLHFSSNDLSGYSSRAMFEFLEAMPNLTYVDFQESALTTFPDIRQLNRTFVFLRFFSHQQMTCDCHLAWYKDSDLYPKYVHDRGEASKYPCFSPETLRNKEWRDITVEELCSGEWKLLKLILI